MADDRLARVELTATFLERLDAIGEFLAEADAAVAFDRLDTENTVQLLSIRHHRQMSFEDQRPASGTP